MINLEWLRTFRTVYKTKSLSRASELLNISQPTVSQHINSLEHYIGQQLFTRKSKGVIETDEGKVVNTLISGSIESLEEAKADGVTVYEVDKRLFAEKVKPMYEAIENEKVKDLVARMRKVKP